MRIEFWFNGKILFEQNSSQIVVPSVEDKVSFRGQMYKVRMRTYYYSPGALPPSLAIILEKL